MPETKPRPVPTGDLETAPPTLEEARVRLGRVLRRVARRLLLERLVRNLGVDLLFFSSGLVLALVVVRLLSLPVSTGLLVPGLVAASLAFSLLRTFLFARPSASQAARALDERLELRERIASALFLRERGGSSDTITAEWESLVAADGLRSLDAARIARSFRPRLPRSLLWTGVPALAALGVWLFVPGLDLLGIELDRDAEAAFQRDVDEQRSELEKRLEALSAEAKARDLPDLEELLASLEDDADPKEKSPADARLRTEPPANAVEAKKEELVALGRREAAIERALSADRFLEAREALEKLASSRLAESELTRPMRSAMKEGSPEKAREELAKLEDQIAALAKKDPAQLTDAERALLEQLSQELASLARSLEGIQGLENLAKSLAAASSGLRPSAEDLRRSLEGMKLSAEELERLARTLEELSLLEKTESTLEEALEDLARLEKHKCPNCGKDRGKPDSKPGGT